jgi:hypothetical protein
VVGDKIVVMKILKKFIYTLTVLFATTIALYSVHNEYVGKGDISNLALESDVSNSYIPGDLFYEDGWIGWIDPKLTKIPPVSIKKGSPTFHGWVIKEDGITMVLCPSAGMNCGILWGEFDDGVRQVGVYVKE